MAPLQEEKAVLRQIVAYPRWWCGMRLAQDGKTSVWGIMTRELEDGAGSIFSLLCEYGKQMQAERLFSRIEDAIAYTDALLTIRQTEGYHPMSSEESEFYNFADPLLHITTQETMYVPEPEKRNNPAVKKPDAGRGQEVCWQCSTARDGKQKYCRTCGAPRREELLLERYLVLEPLGQGGMGTVYLAKDTRLSNRLVAIKEMRTDEVEEEDRALNAEQFKSEMTILASLDHSAIPNIYDYQVEGARAYLVMEYIEGETLAQYLEQVGAIGEYEAIMIAIELCRVLEYLHSQKPPIIFRDLKPSNVMRDRKGRIFLIDFGIARTFKRGQARDTALFGSLGYCAPEQLGTGQSSPRTDIYALGATMHTMLSGDNPADSPMVFKPFARRTGSSPAIEKLVRHMTAPNTQNRPASVLKVREELTAILEDLQ